MIQGGSKAGGGLIVVIFTKGRPAHSMDRVDLELQDALGEGLPSVGFGSCSAAFLQPRKLAPLARGRCNHHGPADSSISLSLQS